MREQSLADRIRDKLFTNALPREEPMKTWAGYGSNRPCCACDETIRRPQVEYEVQMPDGTSFPMHAGCPGLWRAERIRRRWADPPR